MSEDELPVFLVPVEHSEVAWIFVKVYFVDFPAIEYLVDCFLTQAVMGMAIVVIWFPSCDLLLEDTIDKVMVDLVCPLDQSKERVAW